MDFVGENVSIDFDFDTNSCLQWSRLIGGSRTSVGASSKQVLANNPEQRLAQFKSAYKELQVTQDESAR